MTDSRARPGTPGAIERLLAEYIAAKLPDPPGPELDPGPMCARPCPSGLDYCAAHGCELDQLDQVDPLGMIAAGYAPDVVETLMLNQEAELDGAEQ